MSRLKWQARMQAISEEIRQLAAREAELVAEWHRLEYALAQSNWGPGQSLFDLDSDSESGSSISNNDTIIENLPGKGRTDRPNAEHLPR